MEILSQRQLHTARLRGFWTLTKFRQTALLLVTGICAYALTEGVPFDPAEALWMVSALFLSISGCTALNMVLDRDIDVIMERTASRPLPAGLIQPSEALMFGGTLSILGLSFAYALDLAFGLVVSAGFILDLVVYTAWLKRRTPISILLGGASGAMPVLAGRVLALGHIDAIGILLAASVVLWIPSHILALTTRRAAEYRRAGVPTWPSVYGARATRVFTAGSNLLNTTALITAGLMLRIHGAALVALLACSLVICILSTVQLAAPSAKRNWLLFKLASLYMLTSMLLLTLGSLA